MGLFAAGIVLFLLFVATYSQRRTWVALGSTALSMALIAGVVFLLASPDPGSIRQGIARLAKDLPAGWDRRALDLAGTIEQASASLARARKRVSGREPVRAASTADWPPRAPETAPESEPEPVPAPAPMPGHGSLGAPIRWLLDEPPPAASKTFLLSGINASDQPLEAVRAVLKPDRGGREFVLALAVEGGSGDVIPPGARFRLAAPGLARDEAEQLGGAILSFGYVQAGRRQTAITYLTPPMLAQRAARN